MIGEVEFCMVRLVSHRYLHFVGWLATANNLLHLAHPLVLVFHMLEIQWRQVNTEDPNADPEQVELEVLHPKVCEDYYKICAAVDNHNNHYRQSSLMIKK